jgi:hypothetical protein
MRFIGRYPMALGFERMALIISSGRRGGLRALHDAVRVTRQGERAERLARPIAPLALIHDDGRILPSHVLPGTNLSQVDGLQLRE